MGACADKRESRETTLTQRTKEFSRTRTVFVFFIQVRGFFFSLVSSFLLVACLFFDALAVLESRVILSVVFLGSRSERSLFFAKKEKKNKNHAIIIIMIIEIALLTRQGFSLSSFFVFSCHHLLLDHHKLLTDALNLRHS